MKIENLGYLKCDLVDTKCENSSSQLEPTIQDSNSWKGIFDQLNTDKFIISKEKKEVIINNDNVADLQPLVTEEEAETIREFYKRHKLNNNIEAISYSWGPYGFHPDDAWIQTYSGRRFTPTNPDPNAIVIQDIAHALSMQCRFSGHTKEFYSVAQHSVLVSFICDKADALYGLLHDATEAYLVDVPRPLKRSGKFDSYLEFERIMQMAISQRFSLSQKEPESVVRADAIMLATEARDLMSPLRNDWEMKVEPLPFKIIPLNPNDAKSLFLKRFDELVSERSRSLIKDYLKR